MISKTNKGIKIGSKMYGKKGKSESIIAPFSRKILSNMAALNNFIQKVPKIKTQHCSIIAKPDATPTSILGISIIYEKMVQ